ncbi:glycosyltransferase family 4 protein [Sphingobacterium sp. HSC-15S19]|uniref:glycosyltransferase family 4 protein n=1 Tax=Sphingobacterium sp. HSC-15S19 TaxID=2910971 RepID=UPI003D19E660
MKITMVTGSFPPDVCGVGDYTYFLNKEIRKSGYEISIFYRKNWNLFNFAIYLRQLLSNRADYYHLQYPTEGYGYSFLPLFLFAFLPKKSRIITIHEFSNRTQKARIFTAALLYFFPRIICTNHEELSYIKKHKFLRNKDIKIINIGSNIDRSQHALRSFSDRKFDVGYFGHIRPEKGLEEFINTVKALSLLIPIRCCIVGQVLPRYETYFISLRKRCEGLPIEFILNKDSDEISDILSQIRICFLPFPDGISSRRGSMLAAAMANCIIVSRKSSIKEVNDFFKPYIYLLDDISDGADLLYTILSSKAIPKLETSALVANFSWNEIVKEHLVFYNEVIY